MWDHVSVIPPNKIREELTNKSVFNCNVKWKMKHEFSENFNHCNENTSFLYNENEFPSYPVPAGRRLKHLHQHTNFSKVNILWFVTF